MKLVSIKSLHVSSITRTLSFFVVFHVLFLTVEPERLSVSEIKGFMHLLHPLSHIFEGVRVEPVHVLSAVIEEAIAWAELII